MSLLIEITEEFGISRGDLSRIISTGPGRYKIYEIAKRGGGSRTIAQPSREIKELQRFAIRRFLNKFPIHNAAQAYVKDRNIDTNARVHRESEHILKLDFKSFFPSIKVADWLTVASKNDYLFKSRDEVSLLSRILFFSGSNTSYTPRILSIGAPSSPILSNIVMLDIDVFLAQIAEQLGVRYSRYADDITASAERVSELLQFERSARKFIGSSKSPRLTFNDEKRGIFSKGQRRMVTGLIVTPDYQISIGRSRKRMISALIHKFSIGAISLDDLAYLKGMVGFAIANEATFISRMREKYGSITLDQILSYRIPKKRV